MSAIKKEGLSLLFNPYIFSGIFFSAIILVLGLTDANQFSIALQLANKKVLRIFSTYYLAVGFGVVLVSLLLILLPLSKKQLGNEKPEYSFFSWIALLYSTGMGSGLLLRAVQEPSYYLYNPPVHSEHAQQLSLQYTFFHWGFTPWCFYSLFGLIIAYNIYINKAKSFLEALSFSNQGDNIFQKLVGIFIVLITVIGVVASLGLGAGQFAGGMTNYFKLTLDNNFLLWVIFFVGLIATLSALTGIKKVIKYLADFDIVVSLILLLFVFTQTNFLDLIANGIPALKAYVFHFAQMSLSIGRYRVSDSFLSDWTVFYWAFWLAWVPFTGIFIARISKGRTIRQFLIATIIIPTLATTVWFSVFGTQAFSIINKYHLSQNPFDSVFTSLFTFFDYLPFHQITVLLSSVLILLAIINSVDSAIFVLSIFSDQGVENPAKLHKVLWGAVITFTALGLSAVGTNKLLNSVSSILILMALPFSFVYIIYLVKFIRNNILKKNINKP